MILTNIGKILTQTLINNYCKLTLNFFYITLITIYEGLVFNFQDISGIVNNKIANFLRLLIAKKKMSKLYHA